MFFLGERGGSVTFPFPNSTELSHVLKRCHRVTSSPQELGKECVPLCPDDIQAMEGGPFHCATCLVA